MGGSRNVFETPQTAIETWLTETKMPGEKFQTKVSLKKMF